MTEAERTVLRKLKADVASELARGRDAWMADYADVWDTDARIWEYVSGVIDHPDDHNLYEMLCVRRFFDHLSRFHWNATKASRFIMLYEQLKFSGINGRTTYTLTPVQAFFFANIYGMTLDDGRRVYRDVYLFVPRKFAKTTSVAAMAVNDLLFGDSNSQAYIGANSYRQAKICFDEIRAILRGLDPGERHLKINREQVSFRDGLRASTATCLSGNAKTGDGLNASLVIMDEYAQARDTSTKNGADLKNVLTSSMGARREPLTVVITTASDVIDGPFAHELAGVKSVLRGEIQNDYVFAMLFEPDVDDSEDDPHTWHKVQPHIGVTVQHDFYEREWAKAQLSTENMMVFRTKLLNIFAVNERTAWIGAELAAECSRPMSIEGTVGRPESMCAIDLSESNDFSAVTFGIYSAKTKCFQFHTAYFFPEGALAGHPNEAMYRIWVEQGHLILTPGKVIDYRTIVDYILRANKYLLILSIGYDPWKSQDVVNMLSAAGAKKVLVPVRQTYGYFTAPVQSFEHGIKTGHVTINDNPINAYCFGNAILDEDRLENCKPVKRGVNQKIDGVITTLMCMRLFIDYER